MVNKSTKVFAFIVLFLYNSLLFAQEEQVLAIGIQGAPSLTTRYTGKQWEQMQLNYLAGAALRYRFRNHIAFSANLNYEVKGSNYQIANSRNTYNSSYITLPLSLNFKLNKKKQYISPFFNAGVYVGYLIDANLVHRPNGGNEVIYKQFELSNTKRLDWGIVTGIGLKIPIQSSYQILTELRNNFGLRNISSSGHTSNESVAFLIGIMYIL